MWFLLNWYTAVDGFHWFERQNVAMSGLPRHQQAIAIWHVLVLAMVAWAFFGWANGGDIHWIWIPIIVVPVLAIYATFATMQPQHRAIAYWVLAAASIPNAAGGITSIIGWMFIVSVILLIWAARRENPAEEIVQM